MDPPIMGRLIITDDDDNDNRENSDRRQLRRSSRKTEAQQQQQQYRRHTIGGHSLTSVKPNSDQSPTSSQTTQRRASAVPKLAKRPAFPITTNRVTIGSTLEADIRPFGRRLAKSDDQFFVEISVLNDKNIGNTTVGDHRNLNQFFVRSLNGKPLQLNGQLMNGTRKLELKNNDRLTLGAKTVLFRKCKPSEPEVITTEQLSNEVTVDVVVDENQTIQTITKKTDEELYNILIVDKLNESDVKNTEQQSDELVVDVIVDVDEDQSIQTNSKNIVEELSTNDNNILIVDKLNESDVKTCEQQSITVEVDVVVDENQTIQTITKKTDGELSTNDNNNQNVDKLNDSAVKITEQQSNPLAVVVNVDEDQPIQTNSKNIVEELSTKDHNNQNVDKLNDSAVKITEQQSDVVVVVDVVVDVDEDQSIQTISKNTDKELSINDNNIQNVDKLNESNVKNTEQQSDELVVDVIVAVDEDQSIQTNSKNIVEELSTKDHNNQNVDKLNESAVENTEQQSNAVVVDVVVDVDENQSIQTITGNKNTDEELSINDNNNQNVDKLNDSAVKITEQQSNPLAVVVNVDEDQPIQTNSKNIVEELSTKDHNNQNVDKLNESAVENTEQQSNAVVVDVVVDVDENQSIQTITGSKNTDEELSINDNNIPNVDKPNESAMKTSEQPSMSATAVVNENKLIVEEEILQENRDDSEHEDNTRPRTRRAARQQKVETQSKTRRTLRGQAGGVARRKEKHDETAAVSAVDCGPREVLQRAKVGRRSAVVATDDQNANKQSSPPPPEKSSATTHKRARTTRQASQPTIPSGPSAGVRTRAQARARTVEKETLSPHTAPSKRKKRK